MATLDPVALTAALVRCESVTPREGGALDLLEKTLQAHGFQTWRLVFGEAPNGPVDNLFARIGDTGPHLAFAGHSDVVPVGDAAAWSAPPFEARVENGWLVGRGAVDMKGAIAAFVSAAVAHRAQNPKGSLSFVITGDEEGPAQFGTVEMLKWMQAHHHIPDHCVVGEPTSSARVGDVIKVGRRGSINIWIDVLGAQGHVAYPHLADNPATHLVQILSTLKARVLDEGSEWFDASNLEITDIHIGNSATNVIPAKASARINIRFNNLHKGAALEQWVRDVVADYAPTAQVRASISGESFLTQPGDFSAMVQAAIADVTGQAPELSTSGGTSDARFITNYCPVLECGLVGQTMHKVDEAVAVEDIHQLTRIYAGLLQRYFA